MRLLLKIFIIIFSVKASFAQINTIKHAEIKKYKPANHGLKDLVFNVKAPGLAENLNSKEFLGKIENVYFTIYWASPGKFQVDIIGLPRGYHELKFALKKNMIPLLKIIFPDDQANLLRSYSLTSEKITGGEKIYAVDKSGMNPINSKELTFSRDGYLKSIKSYGRQSMEVPNIEFKMSKQSWSHNKWVLLKTTSLISQGARITSLQTEIDYQVLAGFGLPKEVKKTTAVSWKAGTNSVNAFKPIRNVEKFIFSEYQINTGKALKKFLVNQKEDHVKQK